MKVPHMTGMKPGKSTKPYSRKVAPGHSFTHLWQHKERGGLMPETIRRLSNAGEIEEAFIELFDQIDYGLNRYIGSINNRFLKKQALKNTVGMLEILKKLYQNDLHSQIR
jgi:hypothetical protein